MTLYDLELTSHAVCENLAFIIIVTKICYGAAQQELSDLPIV